MHFKMSKVKMKMSEDQHGMPSGSRLIQLCIDAVQHFIRKRKKERQIEEGGREGLEDQNVLGQFD